MPSPINGAGCATTDFFDNLVVSERGEAVVRLRIAPRPGRRCRTITSVRRWAAAKRSRLGRAGRMPCRHSKATRRFATTKKLTLLRQNDRLNKRWFDAPPFEPI